MRRLATSLILVVLLLPACMSAAARKEIDTGTGRVQAIEQSIKSTEAQSPSPERDAALAQLRAQLSEAQTSLDAAKAAGFRDRVSTTAGNVEVAVGAATPLVGLFFPPALAILGIIGSIAGMLKQRFGKQE